MMLDHVRHNNVVHVLTIRYLIIKCLTWNRHFGRCRLAVSRQDITVVGVYYDIAQFLFFA